MEAEEIIPKILQISREPDGHRHVRHRVFEDQIPTDDPREDFPEDRVGIGIRAAGDGNHGSKLGVAEAGEQARNRHQNERQRDGRTRARTPQHGNAVRAMQYEVKHGSVEDRLYFVDLASRRRACESKNAGTDYRSDSKRGQTPGTKRLAQAVFGFL